MKFVRTLLFFTIFYSLLAGPSIALMHSVEEEDLATEVEDWATEESNLAKIFFVSERDGNREIYVMDENGENQKNLTQNPASDQAPALSPDKTKIAFFSNRTGGLGLWVMDVDGNNPYLITELPEADMGLSWAPDGKSLAWNFQRSDDRTHDLAIINTETANWKLVTDTPGVQDLSPSWSPDGSALLFIRDEAEGSALYILNLETGKEIKVTHKPIPGAIFPRWSHDGQSAVVRVRREENFDLAIVDIKTGQIHFVTKNPVNDSGGVWSPNDKKLVFFSDRDGDFEIYMLTLQNSEIKQLTFNKGRDRHPVW